MAGKTQRGRVVDAPAKRFALCTIEKNCTLIRYDLVVVPWNLYDVVMDDAIRQRALQLIETETDPRYHAKYSDVWRIPKRL